MKNKAMQTVNERSTKAEIIQGCCEHIDWIETHSFTRRETAVIAVVALLVGFIAG